MVSQGNLDRTWIQERKKELLALIDFANAEILVMEDRDFAGLIYNCRLFEGDPSWLSFIFRSTSKEPDPQDLVKRKRSLLELQGHLKEKLEEILWAVEAGGQTPILEITGTTVFIAHSSKDRFLLDLKVGDKEANPLEKEKVTLNFRLVDLVRVLGLKPGRFKKCMRRDCGRFFYQSSSKERRYCSTKCSAAYRQSEFQKRKSSPGHRDLKRENVIDTGREVIDELKNEQS